MGLAAETATLILDVDATKAEGALQQFADKCKITKDSIEATWKKLSDFLAEGDRGADIYSHLTISVQQASEAVNGQVSQLNLAIAANRAHQAGLDLTSETLAHLVVVAKDHAEAVGGDETAAIEQLTGALIRGNARGLKPFGIEAGTAAEMMESLKEKFEAIGEATPGTADQISRLTAALEDLKTHAAMACDDQEGLGRLVQVLALLVEALGRSKLAMAAFGELFGTAILVPVTAALGPIGLAVTAVRALNFELGLLGVTPGGDREAIQTTVTTFVGNARVAAEAQAMGRGAVAAAAHQREQRVLEGLAAQTRAKDLAGTQGARQTQLAAEAAIRTGTGTGGIAAQGRGRGSSQQADEDRLRTEEEANEAAITEFLVEQSKRREEVAHEAAIAQIGIQQEASRRRIEIVKREADALKALQQRELGDQRQAADKWIETEKLRNKKDLQATTDWINAAIQIANIAADAMGASESTKSWLKALGMQVQAIEYAVQMNWPQAAVAEAGAIAAVAIAMKQAGRKGAPAGLSGGFGGQAGGTLMSGGGGGGGGSQRGPVNITVVVDAAGGIVGDSQLRRLGQYVRQAQDRGYA